MDARQALINARKKIERPENWFRGNADGSCEDAGPHQHCSYLALLDQIFEGTPDDEFSKAEEALIAAMGGCEIVAFNATHSHAEVLAAWDKAIALLAKPTDITVFKEMLTPRVALVDHQSAADTCGNG